jgi:hypothetical protein
MTKNKKKKKDVYLSGDIICHAAGLGQGYNYGNIGQYKNGRWFIQPDGSEEIAATVSNKRVYAFAEALKPEAPHTLPKTVKIPEEIVSNVITEYLSDTYGYCINDYDIVFNKGKFSVKNIDWDTSE